jgi:hypothetical protein
MSVQGYLAEHASAAQLTLELAQKEAEFQRLGVRPHATCA